MTELDLHIDPEFEAYLEAPDQIPEADLLTAIREAGNQCLDTIKVWGQNGKATILDGHRRYRLAEKHPEIRYTVESIDLPDRSAAYRWIYVYQFSRRNKVPTAAEIQAFRGRWYNAAKKDKATNLPLPKGQIDPLGETLQKQGSTAKSIAEQTGVSESTIKRDGARIKALEKCTDAIQKGINSGTIKATDAQIKTLAGLKPAAKQDAIAKDCRNGATLAKAMAKEKVKPPKPTKPDYGKCPNCAGTKWSEDEDGVSCAKCHHPWGESTGGADEDRVKTQKQKTGKTVEALMRAFDDLQVMHAQTCQSCQLTEDESTDPILCCKRLLKIAKEWK